MRTYEIRRAWDKKQVGMIVEFPNGEALVHFHQTRFRSVLEAREEFAGELITQVPASERARLRLVQFLREEKKAA